MSVKWIVTRGFLNEGGSAKIVVRGFIAAPSTFRDILEEDLQDVFFDTKEFARVGVYTPLSGTPFNLKGILDYPFEEVLPGTSVGVQGTSPKFKCREADLKYGVSKGDKITIKLIEYNVKENQPDGTGISDLILQKV